MPVRLQELHALFVSIESQSHLARDYHTLWAGRLELGCLRCKRDLRLQ